jgi:hypothetical protein
MFKPAFSCRDGTNLTKQSNLQLDLKVTHQAEPLQKCGASLDLLAITVRLAC